MHNLPTILLLSALAAFAALAILRVARASGLLSTLVALAKAGCAAAQDAVTSIVNVTSATTPDGTISIAATGETWYTKNTTMNGKRKVFYLALCSAIAGSGATVTITQQWSLDRGVTWTDGDAFTGITATGNYRKDPSSEVPPLIRFKVVSSGTACTATIKVFIAYSDPSAMARRSD